MGIKRLGTRHAHFDITTVGCIHHAIGFCRKFTAATIDDRQNTRTSRASQVDCAIRVGSCSTLTHRNNKRVAHVELQAKARKFTREQRLDAQTDADQFVQQLGQGLSCNRGGTLADNPNFFNFARRQTITDHFRQNFFSQFCGQHAVVIDDSPTNRFSKTLWCLGDFFCQKMFVFTTIDVARRDFCGQNIVLAQTKYASVIRNQLHARQLAGVRP